MTLDIMQNQRQVRALPFYEVCLHQFIIAIFLWLNSLFQQDVPLFAADGSVFYTILPAKQGARGEFHHIASLSAQVSKLSLPPVILK